MTVVLAGLFGLLIGSFLNVVVWRVPRGESIVSPPSHCPGCDAPIAPRDNVPVVSWLLLRGRCRHCGEPISVRYPLVELLTGGVFAALAARVGLDWALPAYLYLGAVLVALALIDLEHKRLPNVLTLPSYAAGIVLLGAAALLDGEPEVMLRALVGMAVLWGVYALLRLAHPKGMGYGDVKLAGVLGLYLAYLGWRTWFAGWLLGFLLGGVFGVVAILVGRAGRKTKVPFGPFMIVGAFVAILWGEALADWYLRLTGV